MANLTEDLKGQQVSAEFRQMEISEAFNLLLIGMTTVFVVLLLVYGTGTILIHLVNRFGTDSSGSPTEADISSKKIAVLNAAVEAYTKGVGRITSIKKIE